MRLFFSFLIIVLGFIACNKNETYPPSVKIMSPLTNDTLSVSDSVLINATITDKHLSSYKIIVFNSYSKQILYSEKGSAAINPFSINKKVSFALNADTTVYMNILGIDKNGNTGVAGVSFYLKQ